MRTVDGKLGVVACRHRSWAFSSYSHRAQEAWSEQDRQFRTCWPRLRPHNRLHSECKPKVARI